MDITPLFLRWRRLRKTGFNYLKGVHMKTIAIIGLALILSSLVTTPAFPLSYEIDVGGDGSFETGEVVNLSPQGVATVDLYLDGYSCPPDDLIFSGRAYVLLDESIIQVNSCVPFDTDHGGPFDPVLSSCSNPEQNVYFIGAAKYSFVPVSVGRQKFGTMGIEILQNDEYANLVAATDLTSYGYPAYDDCFISDCNLAALYPADGTVTLIRTTNPPCYCDFNGDGRVGLTDIVIMRDEFSRSDCDVNPCQADCNGDGRVNLTDLIMLKIEFNRRDCPIMP
jgi:hypothetical protein